MSRYSINYKDYLGSIRCCNKQIYNCGCNCSGKAGSQGYQGVTGTQGATGSGVQGAQGSAGTQGAIGIQGVTGTGFQGVTGSQGSTGTQGAIGIQGATGPAIPFKIDTQIIPDSDILYGNTNSYIGIYQSFASTYPSCNVTGLGFIGTCSDNVYTYTLFECLENGSIGCGQRTLYEHPIGSTCSSYQYGPLDYPTMFYCNDAKYFCAITGGIDPNILPYPHDAYIDWHWATLYNTTGVRQYNNGKFTFVATYQHILEQYNANVNAGSPDPWISPIPNGVGQFGIPMFNPSNHNNL